MRTLLRRAFALVSFLAFATGALAQADPRSQEPRGAQRSYRVYMVLWRGETDAERGFRDYLAAQKLRVEYIVRNAGQDASRLPGFVSEIRSLKPDLVYTWGTSVTLGIAGPFDAPDPGRHITDIPVVFTLVAAPVGARLVPSLDSPGRNVTGVFHVARFDAQLEAMRAYRPFARLGVLYNSAEANSVAGVREMRARAVSAKFNLIERTFRLNAAGAPSAEGIARLVSEIKQEGAEWLYIGPDTFLFTQLEAVAAAANANKLPTFATTEAVFESSPGVLAGLVSRYYGVGQLAAFKAEQILVHGTAAKQIRVETLQRFSFTIRLEVAKQLGFLPPIAMFNYAEFR